MVCARQFPRARSHLANDRGAGSWRQLFRNERLWAHPTAGEEGTTGVALAATPDQRSRYSTDVILGTERPMSFNA